MSDSAPETTADVAEVAADDGDVSAEALLAAAVAEPDHDTQDGTGHQPEPEVEVGPDGYPLNTPVAEMSPEHQAAYWRAQARKHEKAVKAYGKHTPDKVKEMAARLKEIEDAQKTETEKLAERLAEAERRAQEAEIARARLLAAATHNIPATLLERLAGTTEEEINEAAEVLATEIEAEVERRLTAMQPAKPEPEPEPEPSRAHRPVESLRPGAMPLDDAPPDPNDAFRAFLFGGRR